MKKKKIKKLVDKLARKAMKEIENEAKKLIHRGFEPAQLERDRFVADMAKSAFAKKETWKEVFPASAAVLDFSPQPVLENILAGGEEDEKSN